MNRRLPIGEAKARFAECVRRAESGDDVVLTRHGRPVARLTGLGLAPSSPGEAVGEIRETEATYPVAHPARPAPDSRRAALHRLLEEEIWPRVPAELVGRAVTRREREEILGYGSGGV